jgi:hypothetical protein
MKRLNELTPSDIEELSYNELIGITRETNRPPGGYRTVSNVCRNAFVGPSCKVLEIGTSIMSVK